MIDGLIYSLIHADIFARTAKTTPRLEHRLKKQANVEGILFPILAWRTGRSGLNKTLTNEGVSEIGIDPKNVSVARSLALMLLTTE